MRARIARRKKCRLEMIELSGSQIAAGSAA
jgi:hypothetical protein